MSFDNTVTLKIGKINRGSAPENFYHWKDVSITSSLDSLASSFYVSTTAKLPDGKKIVEAFQIGDGVQVYIGNNLVLTGYIEQRPVSYTATSMSATIQGRSKTGDLVDCSVAPAGMDINFNQSQWTNKKSPNTADFIAVEPPKKTATSWKNVPLKEVIAGLVAPYQIYFYYHQALQSKLDKKVTISPKPTDTVHTVLKDFVKSDDITFTDNEYGNLIAASKEKIVVSGGLRLGKNVLSGSAPFDGTKLFSQIDFRGSKSGKTGATGKAACNIQASSAQSNTLGRFRYLCQDNNNQSTTSSCKTGADGELIYRKQAFKKVTYAVQGWRKENGELWKINELVAVFDEVLGFNNESMLITKVTFKLESSGMTTELEVVPPEGYRNDNDSTSAGKNTKTTTSNSWSGQKLTVIDKDGKTKVVA